MTQKTNISLIDYLETTEDYQEIQITPKLLELKIFLAESENTIITLARINLALWIYSLTLTLYVLKTTFFPKSPKNK